MWKKKNLNKIKLGLALLKGWFLTCIDSLKVCFVGFIELEILKEVEVEGFRCLSKNNQSFGFVIWVEDGIIKCRALSKNSSVKINLKFHYFKKLSLMKELSS